MPEYRRKVLCEPVAIRLKEFFVNFFQIRMRVRGESQDCPKKRNVVDRKNRPLFTGPPGIF